MRCFICDREDDLISFDKVEGKFSPCGDCQRAIEECLDGYDHADAVLEALILHDED